MVQQLKLELFTKIDGLFAKDQMPTYVGDLLGSHLRVWLEGLLARADVGEGVDATPVVDGQVETGAIVKGAVYVGAGARVEAGAYVVGPTYIAPDAEVRHGAYIRGNVYVGRGAVVGHTSEVKGSVLLDGAKAAHFAYVGDSLLCREVNLGAGTKLANLPFKREEIFYRDPDSGLKIASGLRKFGAVLGDRVQTGCNAVLSPGSLLLPDTAVFPCTHFRGTLSRGVAR